MAEILVQRPAQRRRGVCPLGAQVRTTLGMSRKPLSSRNTRWAPSFWAFFYMGPAIPLPEGDGLLITLPRPLFRLLTTPTQGVQETPQMVGVVVDPEPLFDQVRHAARRPKVRGIAGLAGSTQENSCQAPFLPEIQLRRSARHWFGFQPFLTRFAERFAPQEHGTRRAADLGSHLRQAQTFFQQRDSAPPTLFELLLASIRSHTARIA